MNPTSKENGGPSVNPIPEGMRTVTPHLICAGATEAIEFYRKAFDAVELTRMPGPDGKVMHASIRSAIPSLCSTTRIRSGARSVRNISRVRRSPSIYVENAETIFEQAVRAGATVTMPLADMFWGDRYGKVEDPFGHQWSIGTHVREVSSDEMQKAMEGMVS
ncbi:MAG: VOC family protein [Verrucomicrobiota bacterium]|nr:VOC family protein [Verrucomicrobiota bacterium]